MEASLELNCKKTKGFVDYGNGSHYCHGSLKQICPICKNTEALMITRNEFSRIKCSECNSEVRFVNGYYQRIGSLIKGVRQE